MKMTSRRVFYGTFAVVFVVAFNLTAAVGFDLDSLPEWCHLVCYPGAVGSFLFEWIYGWPPALAMLGGYFTAAFSYAVLALAVYGIWSLFRGKRRREPAAVEPGAREP